VRASDVIARWIARMFKQRDLFGRPQSAEEPELVVVALRFTPIAMYRGDECLGVLDGEWANDRSVLLRTLAACTIRRRRKSRRDSVRLILRDNKCYFLLDGLRRKHSGGIAVTRKNQGCYF
jgi:hypothetical protein